MDQQYLNDEFDRFFEFPTEDKSNVSAVSAKLFAEHIAYPLESEIERLSHNLQVTTDAMKEFKALAKERLVEIERRKSQEPVAEIGKHGFKWTQHGLNTDTPVGTKFYTAPPDLAIKVAKLTEQVKIAKEAIFFAKPVMESHAGPSRFAWWEEFLAKLSEKP